MAIQRSTLIYLGSSQTHRRGKQFRNNSVRCLSKITTMCPRSKKIFLTQTWRWVKIGFQGEVSAECVLKDDKVWPYNETEIFLL